MLSLATAAAFLTSAKQVVTPVTTFLLPQRETSRQYWKLWSEVEDTKRLLARLKIHIGELLQLDIELCSLPDLIKMLNIFQQFFYVNYLDINTLNRGLWIQSTTYYRQELNSATQLLLAEAGHVENELDRLNALGTNQVLLTKGNPRKWLNATRELVLEHNTKCTPPQKVFKQSQWDICPACSVPSTREDIKPTLERKKIWDWEAKTTPLIGSDAFRTTQARQTSAPKSTDIDVVLKRAFEAFQSVSDDLYGEQGEGQDVQDEDLEQP